MEKSSTLTEIAEPEIEISIGTETEQRVDKTLVGESYIDFLKSLHKETEKMAVFGEPCIHIGLCPVKDTNCLETKTKHCIIYKRFQKFDKLIDKYSDLENLDNQLKYYFNLAKERASNGKFRNSLVYLRIVGRKLEK